MARTLPSLFDRFRGLLLVAFQVAAAVSSNIKSAGSAFNVATVVTFVCQARGVV